MIELWTIYTLRKYLSSRICHTDKVFMALVTSPFSWTYYVRAFPRGVGTAQTRVCYDDKLFMALVTVHFLLLCLSIPRGVGILQTSFCHNYKLFMALVTSPFSWTYFVRVFPRGVGTAQTRCHHDRVL